MAMFALRQNPTPLIAIALVTALLGFSGCGLMSGNKPNPTASQGVGKKKPPTLQQQLNGLKKENRQLRGKVAELRRALRAAKARPVRTVGGSQTVNVKHSGQIDHRHSGEIRFLFGQNGAPTFPVISPPASK